MENVFLIDDELENTNQDYINENNIIYRQPDLSECEDNKSGIYDIHKLIYKEISRENILLSSKVLEHGSDIEHDSKTLKFDLSLNKSGGVNWKKNVIGFRLNECIFTRPVYNIIKDRNDEMQYFEGKLITIPEGNYTIYSLINAINTHDNNTATRKFTLSYNQETALVSIENISTPTKDISIWKTELFKLLGFHDNFTNTGSALSYLKIETSKTLLADTHPALNIGTYIDIVVDEVPYGACKQNPKGLNIVHRIPIRTEGGSSIVYYKSNFIDHNYQHLFPPMNLSHLTIHLYMDGQELTLGNLTISFEFELVILNK